MFGNVLFAILISLLIGIWLNLNDCTLYRKTGLLSMSVLDSKFKNLEQILHLDLFSSCQNIYRRRLMRYADCDRCREGFRSFYYCRVQSFEIFFWQCMLRGKCL